MYICTHNEWKLWAVLTGQQRFFNTNIYLAPWWSTNHDHFVVFVQFLARQPMFLSSRVKLCTDTVHRYRPADLTNILKIYYLIICIISWVAACDVVLLKSYYGPVVPPPFQTCKHDLQPCRIYWLRSGVLNWINLLLHIVHAVCWTD